MKKKIYVGLKAGRNDEVFRSETEPTRQTHGHIYLAVIGPFRTVRGANFMAKYGCSNPHCTCVDDAEKLAYYQMKGELKC